MEDKQSISCNKKQLIILFVLYFGGYCMLVPRIATRITLLLDPQAVMLNIPVVCILYTVVLLLSVWLLRDLWRISIQVLCSRIGRHILGILGMTLLVLAVNFSLSLIVSMLSGTSDSINQETIRANTMVAPLFTFFSSVLFAPIVEESVFRGGIFTFCRQRMAFVSAALLSAACFGAIHILDSLFTLNLQDMAYFFVYAGMGFVFAYCYERYHTIMVSCGVHVLNNLIAFALMGM